ncbi:hydrogenase assembly protein HupF [Rhizobium calliandrae]|uniref:Hydrogenase assembly protein HupF n=1 Tax=Rhizobium calliandrae TaxID=1312182 RepID=A0ABT7KI24_9HYPH|nr:hydrogenase assembly protein HupF [Rhizobium calliandrae]MDL2408276.1 hydrogenase assembly protein HupF [Rhizobium calliandrae]
MTFLLGAGSIRIDVTVTQALASSVEVRVSRAQGLTRMFIGRRPEEAPVLAGQVFSLCGFSQSVAARLAILNAANLPMPAEGRSAAMAGLLAERIFETLRALILHWPSLLAGAVAEAGQYLRRALTASQAIIDDAKAMRTDHISLTANTRRLGAAAARLGIPEDDGLSRDGTACAAIFRDIEDDRTFKGRPPDPLTAGDDAEVIAHLCRDAGYSILPHLAGRVAETGAYARLCGASGSDGPHLAQRFMARMRDVRLCLMQLQHLAKGQNDPPELMAGGPTPGTGGFGAVECARGRLYHQAEIGVDGKLCAYRILAPTEWNFHPAGPFVETLLSSRIGAGESAARSVSRLAVLFDPCVGFKLGIRDVAHA